MRDWPPRPLAAVFNNAGVAVAATVQDAVPEDDDWLREINFHGVVNGIRAFLPMLIEQDDGVIVTTSSVFGLLGVPYQSAYCASKFAVRGFTDALRQELRGTGVRAVTVHPGGVMTNIARNARIRKDPEGLGRTKEQMAAGIRGGHHDVAGPRRRDHPPWRRARQGSDSGRPGRLPVRRPRPGRSHALLRHCWDASSRSCADATRQMPEPR